MLIYNSMILWVVVVWMWYGFTHANRSNNNQNSYEVSLSFALITMGYIVFWAGIRSGVADTAEYISMFENCKTGLAEIPNILVGESKAPGFEIINVLFKTYISEDYHVWLFVIASVSGILVMSVLRKHSVDYFFSVFLFVVTLNFFWMFNGIRQFLVVVILFYLSDWIKDGKFIRYMVAILLVSTIHFTVLIMIPAYWIARAKLFGKRIILFVVFMVIAVIYLEPVIETMELLLEETAYGGYTEQFAMDDGVNPIRVLVMAVTPMVAFVARNQLRIYDDKYINICVNMSVISFGLYFFGMFTSGILMGRLPIYFEIYNLILLPYILRKCFTKESADIMYFFCAVGFLGFYYLQMRSSYYISDLTGLIGG